LPIFFPIAAGLFVLPFTVGAAVLIVSLFALSDIAYNDRNHARILADWQSLLPVGEAYLPHWPLEDFSLFVAEQTAEVERDGTTVLVFRTRLHHWRGSAWRAGQLCPNLVDLAGAKAHFVDGSDLTQITAAWFDYRELVAAVNRKRFERVFVRAHADNGRELRAASLALSTVS
jgi:hypothetical protein